MARALAINAVSSPVNPVLDYWNLDGGQLADVAGLSFAIFGPDGAQVYPVSGWQTIDISGVDHLAPGHYVAEWTGAGTPGAYQVKWVVAPVVGPSRSAVTAFDLVASGLNTRGPLYAALSDVRAEGFAPATISDAQALNVLRRCSLMLERWTHRFFEPRYRTVKLDGASGSTQFLDDPIIAVDSTTIGGDTIDPTSYRVFNRHITQGLNAPDDRDDPRITFANQGRAGSLVFDGNGSAWRWRSFFWGGAQNVQLAGLFGYTDPDPDVPVGVTPELIKYVTLLLFARESASIADPDGRASAQNAFRINQIRTRDQSINYGTSGGSGQSSTSGGDFTGDPAIDSIIAQFCAPPFVGST